MQGMNTQDYFMQMMMQNTNAESMTIDTSKDGAKKEQKPEKSVQEYYDEFNFE